MRTFFYLFILLRAVSANAALLDATDVAVDSTLHPLKIVTLAPSVAELAAEFLGPDLSRIIAVSERTDFPIALQKKKSIGTFSAFNIESVVAAKPDLILATLDGNPKERVLRLRALGLRVVVVGTLKLSDVAQAMRVVAAALGEPGRGEKEAELFMNQLLKIKGDAASLKSPSRVLLQVGEDPLVVAGGHSFLNEALEVVGAKNIYSDLKTAYPRPALEDVLSRNPDDIVVVSMSANTQAAQKMAQAWKKFTHLSAVKHGKIHIISGDLLLRPSLRLLDGLAALKTSLAGG